MRHYQVWQLVKFHVLLEEYLIGSRYLVIRQRGHERVPQEAIDHQIGPTIGLLRGLCEETELRAGLQRIDGSIRRFLLDGVTHEQLTTEIRVLFESIHGELQYRRFAFVPSDKASVLDNIGRDWKPAWENLADVEQDARDATECYALEKSTACVFHSMRIAEHCLRALAKRLKVKLTHSGKPQPLEFAEWDKVITGCNNRITAARSLSPGAKKQARLEIYSDAAQHCLFMKDIWRNSISHARKPYIEAEALAVLNRVRDFAIFVSTRALTKVR